jgi:hypothetical protein
MPDQKDFLPLPKDSTAHCILEEISYSTHKTGQRDFTQRHDSVEQFILLGDSQDTVILSPMNSWLDRPQ